MYAFFLCGPLDRRFCVLHEPAPGIKKRGAILYLHPFAEEMNKSRHMVGLQARALARAGWVVLQPDLHGCGDSDGDFGETTWQHWVSDALYAANWLHRHSGFRPIFWALRAGCLLAVAAAWSLDWGSDMVFWQPVISGRTHLNQFLRLRLANEMLGGAKRSNCGVQAIRKALADEGSYEVAGYLLTPALVSGMDAAVLDPPPIPRRLFWMDICGNVTPRLSSATGACIKSWKEVGWQVTHKSIAGAPFWQTLEIEEAPGLVEETMSLLGNSH